MKRIFYFIQVPWGWIKQRPHFIAEGLSRHFEVYVVHNRPYTKHRLVKSNNILNLTINQLWVIPFAYLSKINAYIITKQIKRTINDFDIIWLTHPFQYAQIQNVIPAGKKVIYDCMDDILEFCMMRGGKQLYDHVRTIEKALICRSDLVFVSSDHLRQKLTERYKFSDKYVTLNNAMSISNGLIEKKNTDDPITTSLNTFFDPGTKNISYIGTVAEWFDFELVLESLRKFEDLTYNLFGPSEIKIPGHERLKYFGPIEHEYVSEVMKRSDALVMPFKLTDLVLSVDPVKLYEYIYSGQPSIAIAYGETRKFKEYVYLYNNKDDYFRLIGQIFNGTFPAKKSAEECKSFAVKNIWERRIDLILECLQSKGY